MALALNPNMGRVVTCRGWADGLPYHAMPTRVSARVTPAAIYRELSEPPPQATTKLAFIRKLNFKGGETTYRHTPLKLTFP